MQKETNKDLARVLYIPHGAGPLPLLGHAGHEHLVTFLRKIIAELGNPAAILVISAHWEEKHPTVTSGVAPPLIYDYSGFPPESYEIEYPAVGDPELANRIHQLLTDSGIVAKLDDKRGFDHGLFVPLKLMYPEASIPCVQLSLLKNLDPLEHIRVGKALATLRKENILIIGSGFSFHNMEAFSFNGSDKADTKSIWFDQWLGDTCTYPGLAPEEREQRLVAWEKVPHARYCHPREEHLLPLYVCFGIAGHRAGLVFNSPVLGKKTSAFLW